MAKKKNDPTLAENIEIKVAQLEAELRYQLKSAADAIRDALDRAENPNFSYNNLGELQGLVSQYEAAVGGLATFQSLRKMDIPD